MVGRRRDRAFIEMREVADEGGRPRARALGRSGAGAAGLGSYAHYLRITLHQLGPHRRAWFIPVRGRSPVCGAVCFSSALQQQPLVHWVLLKFLMARCALS